MTAKCGSAHDHGAHVILVATATGLRKRWCGGNRNILTAV